MGNQDSRNRRPARAASLWVDVAVSRRRRPGPTLPVRNGSRDPGLGAAVARVLYRTPLPILEPKADYEHNGLVGDVVFPSATDLREDGALDVYYGAADHVIAAHA
jgi:hypothetical protein